MATTDIKPRWEDGVPWCDSGCPQIYHTQSFPNFVRRCGLDEEHRGDRFVCPHAASRMAQWMREARETLGKLEIDNDSHWSCVIVGDQPLAGDVRALIATYPNPDDQEGGA